LLRLDASRLCVFSRCAILERFLNQAFCAFPLLERRAEAVFLQKNTLLTRAAGLAADRPVPCLRGEMPPSQGLCRTGRCGLLRPLFVERLGGDIHTDDFFQLRGRFCRIRLAKYADNISSDLHRCQHESPGETPPPQYQGEGRIAQLAFDPAPTAGNLWCALPRCKENGRPDSMVNVNIDWTATAALGTETLVDAHDAFMDYLLRYLPGECQQCSPRAALGVAETKFTLTLSAEENGGTTVITFGHACFHLV
jgi:hypothetical protein